MAQTTSGVSGRALYVAIATNTAYTAISGLAASVEVDGGERNMGETFTAEGDTPIVTPGKRAALNVKVKAVYTEATAEAYQLVKTAYEAASALYVRWAPKGATTGYEQYTTAQGVVTNPPYQGVADVGDGSALMVEFSVMVPSISGAAIA